MSIERCQLNKGILAPRNQPVKTILPYPGTQTNVTFYTKEMRSVAEKLLPIRPLTLFANATKIPRLDYAVSRERDSIASAASTCRLILLRSSGVRPLLLISLALA